MSGAWKTLAGGSDGLVLAVDFDTTGRPEARFTDLVGNLGGRLAVWETVPPRTGPDGSAAEKDHIEHWAAPLEAEKTQVKALMGFCAGAVYAAALADRIAPWQESEPLLVVFDPELSTSQTLMWQFHKVIGFLSAVLSPEQIAAARTAGQQVSDSTPDLGDLKDGLIRLMRETGEPALVAAGLDAPRREELFEVFTTFMTYLAAAGELDPVERWRTAVCYQSLTPLSGLNAVRAAGLGHLVAVGSEIGVEVEHGVMLADKGLAEAVSELLGQSTSTIGL